MIISSIEGSEGPLYGCPVQPSPHVQIARDVGVVVVIKKSVVDDRVVANQHSANQQQAQAKAQTKVQSALFRRANCRAGRHHFPASSMAAISWASEKVGEVR